jgi:hypothetical protein
MANSIDWGKIYCFTEFGNEDFTIAEIIPAESSPECFLGALEGNQIETLALTIDDITLYTADNTNLQADQTLVQLYT